MPTDKQGNTHSIKGKPSGAQESEGTGLQPTPPEKMKKYNEVTDKYMNSSNEIADNVHVRHVNRDIPEDESDYKERMLNPERDQTQKERQDKNKTSPDITELPLPLTRELFKELAMEKSANLVSVFLNTHQSGMEVNEGQDAVSFKNAIKEAESLLDARHADKTLTERMLSPAYELLHDTMFWKDMKKGLGLFISPGRFNYIKLNYAPGSKVIVERTFYVLPLLSAVMSDKHFFLLDLSKGENRFFKGNKFGLEPMEIDNMPSGAMDEISDRGVSIIFRYSGQGSMHGYGDDTENDKAYLEKYIRRVDDAVVSQIGNSGAPLVLCGVEFVTDIYRNVTSYKNVLRQTITGNNQHENANQLFEKAIGIAGQYLQDSEEKALKEYGNLSATEKTSNDPDDVISASYYGKIKDLFVKKEAEYWGTFDEMANQVTHLDKITDDAEDLIDNAVVNTIIHGGDVYILDEKMPDDKDIAAVFRY